MTHLPPPTSHLPPPTSHLPPPSSLRSPLSGRFGRFAVKRSLLLSAALLTLPFQGLAQDVPLRSGPPPAPDQIPGPAAGQSDFLLRNAPAAPLPTGSPRLDAMRARAAGLLEQHGRYASEVAAGRRDPHAHLRRARPRHLRQLAALTRSVAEVTAEEDPDRRAVLSKALFAGLQPLGSQLEYADPGQGHINLITEQQQARLERLETAWIDAQDGHPDDASPVTPLGPGRYYTLTHLSVPLTVKAAPAATVYFHTHGGGFFSNRLPIIAVEADENGIARAEWITHGDAIAENTISVRSPQGPSRGEFGVTIVKLMLRDLPAAPAGVPDPPDPIAP